MNTRDVIAYAQSRGLEASTVTVQHWRNGYYQNNAGEKVWYFPDHLRLPFVKSNIGIGYEYARVSVQTWIDLLLEKYNK